jgi:hypothetical protein
MNSSAAPASLIFTLAHSIIVNHSAIVDISPNQVAIDFLPTCRKLFENNLITRLSFYLTLFRLRHLLRYLSAPFWKIALGLEKLATRFLSKTW